MANDSDRKNRTYFKKNVAIESYTENELMLCYVNDELMLTSVKDTTGHPKLFKNIEEAKEYTQARHLKIVSIHTLFEEMCECKQDRFIYNPKKKNDINLVSYQYVYSCAYAGKVVIRTWDNKLYIGSMFNSDCGYYDNTDDSLVYITDNMNLLPLLQGAHFSNTQDELLELGEFTEDDFKEWADIVEEKVGSYNVRYELLFAGNSFENLSVYAQLPDVNVSMTAFLKILGIEKEPRNADEFMLITAENELWNFPEITKDVLVENRMPIVGVMCDGELRYFQIPKDKISAFMPPEGEEILEADIDGEGEVPDEAIPLNMKIVKLLMTLVEDIHKLKEEAELYSDGEIVCYNTYEKELKEYIEKIREGAVYEESKVPDLAEYVPAGAVNHREDKHRHLADDVKTLISYSIEKYGGNLYGE